MMLAETPNQKTRGQCRLLGDDLGWIFMWGDFGWDPEKKQWWKKATDDRWQKGFTEDVPARTIENKFIFFEKAKSL